MSSDFDGIDRREVLRYAGLLGAGAILGCGARGARDAISERVHLTPLVDTHEHLPDEVDRLGGRSFPCDDWSLLLHDYVSSDLRSAGMPDESLDRLFAADGDPVGKWQFVEPYWPRVKNTGFGQAVRLTLRELYGIDGLEKGTIPALQRAYEDLRRPGFYKRVLNDTANIESCQVNSHGPPFRKSRQPALLMQDLSFQNLYIDPDIEELSSVAGLEVRSLDDWHAVIRWWFDNFSRFAVAAKSQGAYLRGINHRRVAPEIAAPIFDRWLAAQTASTDDVRLLEDHLFWYCTDQATRYGLPVKIHTGYLAGDRLSQFRRIGDHPADIIELCRRGPETRFVFLHIGYPYWRELIAVAKRFANAHLDMSWAWILDPAGARDFLKRYLVTAPANKIFPFGGDYSVVECVAGHAVLARQGIVRALTELVDEGWIGTDEAVALVESLLRGNARQFFRLEEKERVLSRAPWL